MARNSSSSSAPASGGTGFAGLLTIAFVVLKLTHEIRWSWWWVLSPLWIGASIFVLIILFVLATALIVSLTTGRGR